YLGGRLHLRAASTLRWADRPVPTDPDPDDPTGQRLRQLEHRALQGLASRIPEAIRGTAEIVSGELEEIAAGAGLDPSLVICATQGRRGLARLLAGSASEALVRNSTCPILVLRRAEQPPAAVRIQQVLVAIDPGSPSGEALSAVRRWFPGANVDVASVLSDHEPLTDRDVLSGVVAPGDHPQRAWAMERLAEAGIDATPLLLLAGRRSVGAVLSEVASGYDLIAVTTHGRQGLAHLWWGSVAERLARLASVPVLVVPMGDGDG
ncbi:MAG TPA: hypothetical protein ENK18_23435, partial [Deltaproteobacteria bacterium]|nr:hypothetical protein [Deltaproteobacteria bacterium]